ncbi:hypothetical protein [Sphingobium aquiterrae]|uniref:hypothetical protein n=1 Tax=Sphingobium aquiterrae TaxID=2038656 RepID=UPI003017306B
MVVAEISFTHLNDWRGQLRDTETGSKIGGEWRAEQRGQLIGMMRSKVPLSHLQFVDSERIL